MLWLVQVHRNFLLDHFPFLLDFSRVKFRVQKHVHQHFKQLLEAIVARPGLETGRFLAGERVERAAYPFDSLRDFPRRTFARAFEEQVFDEVTSPIHLRRLVTRPHTGP